MMKQKPWRAESGFVSILTVILFMIFISLIVVAFMTIVSDDNRQTTDNDLSQNALSAARSGIEEGKRILLYCEQSPTPAACTDAVLNSTQCDAFTTADGQTIANALSIPYKSNGEVSVGGNDAYQQFFTCLTITRDTASVEDKVTSASDYIVKLQTVNNDPFDTLNISWKSLSDSAYGFPTGGVGTWTSETNWKQGTSARPPVLRVQLIPYQETDFDLTAPDALDEIEKNSKTVFIAPCMTPLAPGCTSNNAVSTMDIRQPAGVKRTGTAPVTYAPCSGTSSYTCTTKLSFLIPSPPAKQPTFYARISIIYGQNAMVSLAPSKGGVPVRLWNVQPLIDVTGRTNDVFRRVRARVSHDPGIALPRYAIDSAAPICKDMFVTDSATTSQLNCTY